MKRLFFKLNLVLFIAFACLVSAKASAVELLASWENDTFTAAVMPTNTSFSREQLRLAPIEVYNELNIRVPVFYENIVLLEGNLHSLATVSAQNVDLGSSFYLVLEGFSSQQVNRYIFEVFVDRQAIVTRPLSVGANTQAPRGYIENSQSARVRQLLDELQHGRWNNSQPEFGNNTARPSIRSSEGPNGEQSHRNDIENTDDGSGTSVSTGNIGPVIIPQQNASGEITVASAASAVPDHAYILQTSLVASELGHYRTLSAILGVFLFFLFGSFLCLYLVKSLGEKGFSVKQGESSSNQLRDVERLLELQSAQFIKTIEAILPHGGALGSEPRTRKIAPIVADPALNIDNFDEVPVRRTTPIVPDQGAQERSAQQTETAVVPKAHSKVVGGQLKGTTSSPKVTLERSIGGTPKNVESAHPAETKDAPPTGDVKKVPGPEVSDKIDIIQIYRNMGDFQMARTLARELVRNGSEFEKQRAALILEELK